MILDVIAWTLIVGATVGLIVCAFWHPREPVRPMTRRDVDRFLRWVDQDRRDHPERES